jgi:hypothetical protein
MSEETVKIPKFRKTGRIASWMEKNEYEGRMPEQVEALFFNTKESAEEILINLTSYHCQIGSLPENLENLLYEKAKECIPNAQESLSFVHDLLAYCWHNLAHYGDTPEKAQKYIDLFKGKSAKLVQWALWTKTRLPDYLEDSIDDPSQLLDYAKEVVRGRVPSHLEDVFLKDVHSATEYAFEVIRGFAPVRLPDALHNFVIMESFKNPSDYQIKVYMKASESDPNKTGNSDECL